MEFQERDPEPRGSWSKLPKAAEGFRAQSTARVHTPVLPHASCVTLDRLLNFSVGFLICKMDNGPYLTELSSGFTELILVKCLDQHGT